jgi:carbamate kinase
VVAIGGDALLTKHEKMQCKRQLREQLTECTVRMVGTTMALM